MEIEKKNLEVTESNPYNFAKPVASLEELAGRSTELEEIKQALIDGQMSIAIVGPSGIGKSSLLNGSVQLSDELGYINVYVQLDSGIAQDEYLVFREIYFELLKALRYKDKLEETEYENFRKAMEFSDDEAYSFLNFPRAFKSYYTSKVKLPISRQFLKEDFICLQEKAGAKIAVFIDESDSIANAKNRSLLECLRNILQSVQGYTFVLAGTDKMIADMTEVFSPMARQFRRIDIEGFKTYSQTLDLIYKPFANSKNDPPEISYNTLLDLHKIAAGNPYELKVLCYAMWDRVRNFSKKEYILSPKIFSQVAKLMQDSAPSHQSFIYEIKSYSIDDLMLLVSLVNNEGLTLRQKVALDVFMDDSSSNIEELLTDKYEQAVIKFKNVIERTIDDKIKFKGEQFEKLFLKYWAQSKFKNEEIRWSNLSFPLAMMDKVYRKGARPFIKLLSKKLITYQYLINDSAHSKEIFVKEWFDVGMRSFSDPEAAEWDDGWNISNFIKTYLKFKGEPKFYFVESHMHYEGDEYKTFISIEYEDGIEKIKDALFKYQEYFTKYGIELNYYVESLATFPTEKFFNCLFTFSRKDKNKYSKLCSYLVRAGIVLFIEGYYLDSINQFKNILKIDKEDMSSNLSNIGFVHLKMGQFEDAEDYFLQAIKAISKKTDNDIPYYNLATLYIFKKEYEAALKILKKVKKDSSVELMVAYTFFIGQEPDLDRLSFNIDLDVMIKLINAYALYMFDKKKVGKVEADLRAGYKLLKGNPLYLDALCAFYKETKNNERLRYYEQEKAVFE